MLKKSGQSKPKSFANQLLLKRLEIAGFNNIATLTGDNPQEAIDTLVFGRELIRGPNLTKRNKYSDAFTDGELNEKFSIDQGEITRSTTDVQTFNIQLTDQTSQAELAIGTSIVFASGQSALFSDESIKVVHDQKKGAAFQIEVAQHIRPNVFKTIGEFTVDHKQPNGLSADTTKRIQSAANVYKLLDELIKLYENSTLTNTKNRNAEMQKLLSAAFIIAENDKLTNENKVEMILAKSRSVLNNENKNAGKFSLTGLFHNKLSTQHSGTESFASALKSIISTHDPHEKALRRMYSEMNQLSTAQDSTSAEAKMLALHKEFINYVKTHRLDSNPEYKQSIVVFNNLYRKAHEHISATLSQEEDDVVILPKSEPKQHKTSKHDDDVTFVHPKDTKFPIIEMHKKMILHELQELRDSELLAPQTRTTISAIMKCLKANNIDQKQFETIIQSACKRRNLLQKQGKIPKEVGKQFTRVLNALNEVHNEKMSPTKFESIIRHEFKNLKESRKEALGMESRSSRLRY